MENSQKLFCFDYKNIIVDEIALSGLDGVGFDLLWKLVGKRISNSVTNKMKERFWKFIVDCNAISLYINPVPLPVIELKDRCSIIHPKSGLVNDPPDYLDGPYEYCPIEGEYGSCVHYKTRTVLKKESIQSISYEKIAAEYFDTLVMVASIEERCHALAPNMPIQFILTLNTVQYCELELIGRARENGQSSVGKSNILLIDNDPKLLFYNRKILQNFDLVDARNFTQWVGTKSLRSLIIRLKRFHTSIFHDYPTHGIISDLCKYLLDKEDLCESTDILMEKHLLCTKVFKKLNKTVSSYLFSSEYKTVLDESSKAKGPIKKRFMRLNIPSDDSSGSDDEGTEASEPLKCQYKVKVNLLRQAYELILEAGLNGLTLNELSNLLGTDFYVSRSICRTFTQNKLVRDFVDDKGKQKQYKYVAMTATEDFNSKYSEEVKTYMQYLNDNKIAGNNSKNLCEIPSTSKLIHDDEEVPAKKIKLEESEVNNFDDHNIDDHTTELAVLEGFENQNFESLFIGLSGKKLPSVRQLRYANMILKIIHENKVVCGLYNLASMVIKALNQTNIDYKGIKVLIQRLLIDRQIKIYKIKIPGHLNKCHLLVCAPYIKVTDGIVKSKFRELVTKTMVTVKPKIKPLTTCTPLTHCTYPRFMKLQKLHEIIVKTVYFSEEPPDSNSGALPHGFSSLVKLIPEFTVEFALGNISMFSGAELNRVNISMDLYPLKLRDVQQNVMESLLNSDSLQASIKESLKTLAGIGLIQMIKDPSLGRKNSKMIVTYIFYVNRYPKIYNTTGKWPRNTCDKNNLEKRYFFETFEAVQQYWTDVYNIATNTKIEGKKDRKTIVTPIRQQNEVYENDNGQIFGDGLGPCGFDSSVRMDLKKSWSNFYNKVKENRKNVLPNLQLNKNKTKISSKSRKIVKKKKKPESTIVTKIPTKPGAVRKRKVFEAPKNWSAEEDKILMFCKAAISILSPVSQPGCLIVRNIIAKDILSMYDPKKDACNCHKRCTFLEANKSLGYLNECIINELKYRNLLTKYEGLLKKLRLQYSKNMRKVISEARVSMLELIWLILQIERSKSFMRQIPCVALNHKEFHDNFTITKSGDGLKNYYRYSDNLNDEISLVKEAIVLTVMASYKETLSVESAKKIYSLLSSYPEQQLHTSIHQLRKAGAIAAKEKFVNSQYNKYQFRDLTQSAYKISVPYTRKWICRLNSEFIDDLLKSLSGLHEGSLKGSPGINCLLLEQHACNFLEVITTTTPNILDPSGNPIPENRLHDMDDVKLCFKSGCCSWRNKTRAKNFAELYQDIEFESALEELVRNCCVTVVNSAEVKEEKKIISHLKANAQLGTSFKELLEVTEYNTIKLKNTLLNLESKSIIKRVGINENVIILTEFSKPWTAHIKTQAIIPVPWLTPDLKMRYSIFLKWLAVVANKIVENPGSSLNSLADSCETMTTRAVQDICMFLQKTECITMKVITIHEPSLFSEDDQQANELTEFNEYESVHNILVFPLKNSFTKYGSLVKRITDKYNIDL